MRAVFCIAAAIACIAAPLCAQPGSPGKLGKWRLDIAHSKLGPAPPPAEDMRLYEAAPNGMIRSIHRVIYADGHSATTTYTAKDDGTDYPMTDARGAVIGTIALLARGPRTQTFVTKRDGRITGTGITEISPDGITLRMTIVPGQPAARAQTLDMIFDRAD
ncbi:hypothetical protein [Novosphingobium sp.]|uniref:hypothetical protein n=1 Tax=Novosphingobium sp. TaxID=1874826 RepID=UPI003D144243